MTNMSPEEIIKIGASAAKHGDRELFITAIVFVILAGLAIVLYLVRKSEAQNREAKTERDTHLATLGSIMTQQSKKAEEFAVLVASNTKALEGNTQVMEKHTPVLERVAQELRNCADERAARGRRK